VSPPTYSLVVPIFNEEQTLPELQRRLAALLDRLDGSSEVLLVDDGSRDGSYSEIERIVTADPRFRAVRLSRNFGHQIAITAGLDLAGGEAVVVLDADLQDPPEVVLELARRWREGYDVVYAVREARAGETRFKEWTAAGFYRLFRRIADVDIPVDVGDFRLVDRRALDAFKLMRENNRFVRGMFAWIGYRQTGVPYERSVRHAGDTKYPLRKMVKFAADGIVSFSNAPLRIVLKLGFLVSIGSFVFGISALVVRLLGLYSVPGLASLVVVTAFVGGVQLIVLGVIGEYIARIHDEVKNRPLYLVSELRGFDAGATD
jgi:polyisoprenyl-phosphate glycosyltransferase